MKKAYGGVIIDEVGQVLLREPTNHFDGYVWTFAKGKADPGESAEATALREVAEETEIRAKIVAKIPGPSRRLPYRGILIPTSNVKNIVAVIGGTVLGIGALLAALFGDTSEHRVKGGIAFVAYLGLFLMFLRAFVARKQGIVLTDDGLVWNDQLFGTGLIPWAEIAEARCYVHRQTYSSPPSFGLRVERLDNLKLSGATNRKLAENLKRWGWHCYYHSESVLLPLQTIERTVNFYKDHPEARWELVTGSAPDRIAAFELAEAVGP